MGFPRGYQGRYKGAGMSDINALCQEIMRGPEAFQTCGPLLDLLEEQSDWRFKELHELVGWVCQTVNSSPRVWDWHRKSPWELGLTGSSSVVDIFRRRFHQLCWEELEGGRANALRINTPTT